jgi:hypothetical protein
MSVVEHVKYREMKLHEMQWRNHSSQVGGTILTYSDFTEKFWGSSI